MGAGTGDDLPIRHAYRACDPWPSRLAGGLEVGCPREDPQHCLIVVVGPESIRHRAVDEGGRHLAVARGGYHVVRDVP
jgi:hypothetical protein